MSLIDVKTIRAVRKKVIASLSLTETKEVAWFQSKIDSLEDSQLKEYYEVSSRAKVILTEDDGAAKLTRYSIALGFSNSYLAQLAGIAQTFNKTEYSALIKMRRENGRLLGIGHLLVLSQTANGNTRKKALEVTLKESLSSEQMRAMISANVGGGSRSPNPTGRPVIGPRSPGAAVVGLEKICAKLVKDSQGYLKQLNVLSDKPDKFKREQFFKRVEDITEAMDEAQSFLNECRTQILAAKAALDGTGKKKKNGLRKLKLLKTVKMTEAPGA